MPLTTSISFGSANQASKTYANQFKNITDGTHDFRIKPGADLIETGATDATNAGTDIAGTVRPAVVTYDIGCWEMITETVVHTIGTSSRDYSTPQAWEDACPANLVTQNQIWRGECYNDSEFYSGSGNIVVISGETTDVYCYIDLTAAAGQSFQDNTGVRTNPLCYDQSKGVGFRTDTTYSGATCNCSGVTYIHVSRLQLKSQTQAAPLNAATGNVIVDNCFMQSDNRIICITGGSASRITNTVTYVNNAAAGASYQAAMVFFYGGTVLGCTVVRNPIYSATGKGIRCSNSAVAESNAIFGFTTPIDNFATGVNNATDQSSLGVGTGQTSVPFTATTPFVQAGASGTDLRAITGTPLVAHGFLDSTAPLDISKFTRAASPTIGAWELAPVTKLASLSGTALAGIVETDLVTGGKTIVITLTGDTFVQ